MRRSMTGTLDRLRSFRGLQLFQRAILELVARFSHEHDVGNLKARFQQLDVDGQGALSREELQTAFTATGRELAEGELEDIFQSLDADGNGQVNYSEWIAATMRPTLV